MAGPTLVGISLIFLFLWFPRLFISSAIEAAHPETMGEEGAYLFPSLLFRDSPEQFPEPGLENVLELPTEPGLGNVSELPIVSFERVVSPFKKLMQEDSQRPGVQGS